MPSHCYVTTLVILLLNLGVRCNEESEFFFFLCDLILQSGVVISVMTNCLTFWYVCGFNRVTLNLFSLLTWVLATNCFFFILHKSLAGKKVFHLMVSMFIWLKIYTLHPSVNSHVMNFGHLSMYMIMSLNPIPSPTSSVAPKMFIEEEPDRLHRCTVIDN